MQVEIHITTTPLISKQLDDFALFCEEIGAKPIIIELENADIPQHPMISKTADVEDKTAVVAEIDGLKSQFIRAGYGVARVKLEVDIKDQTSGQALFPDYRGGYFEWHGQVDEATCDLVRQMKYNNQVHISQNALKGRSGRRLLTIRHAHSKHFMLKAIGDLKMYLEHKNALIEKEQFEYCIYDSNKDLDNGWIETPKITDRNYLDMLSFEAFLRRAATTDMPFMLKGSLLSRQYKKNKDDRVVEDIDFLYFGEVQDDMDFMSDKLSAWAEAVTTAAIDDGVQYTPFSENKFWRMIEYAMHDDFPTVNTDLSCVVKQTLNDYIGLDISWGLPLHVKPVSLLYHPIEGEPFEIKYTTPLSLQISWKLHQCVVRPRLKDLIDICDLIKEAQPSSETFKESVREYIRECHKDQIDPNRLLAYLDGSVRRYLNYQPGPLAKLFRIQIKVPPIPLLNALTRPHEWNSLSHTFNNLHKRYGRVDDILIDFEQTLIKAGYGQLLDDSV